MTKTDTSFVAAAKDFFGFLPGQKLVSFSAELKALGDEDRIYLTKGLESVGYNIRKA